MVAEGGGEGGGGRGGGRGGRCKGKRKNTNCDTQKGKEIILVSLMSGSVLLGRFTYKLQV